MRLRSIVFALGLVSATIAGCSSDAESPRGLSDADMTALRAIADKDAPTVRAREWAAVAAGYTEDAVRMPPNGPAIQGRDAIRTSLDQMPPITAFDFRLIDLQGDGEIAYIRATWSYTLAPPGAAQAVSDSGKILIVLRKQADGSWLRVVDAWNSDLAASR